MLNKSSTSRVAGLCARFREGLLAIPGVTLVTPLAAAESAGLISFRLAGKTAADIDAELYRRGLVIRTVAGNGLRASFHFYNTAGEVEGLLEAIRTLSA